MADLHEIRSKELIKTLTRLEEPSTFESLASQSRPCRTSIGSSKGPPSNHPKK